MVVEVFLCHPYPSPCPCPSPDPCYRSPWPLAVGLSRSSIALRRELALDLVRQGPPSIHDVQKQTYKQTYVSVSKGGVYERITSYVRYEELHIYVREYK